MNQKPLPLLVVAGFLVFIAGYFSAGFIDDASAARLDLTRFWEASKIMQSKYPFKEKIPNNSKQVDGAIRGLVASYGDPYTSYLTRDQLKSLKDDVAGSFSGIGVEIDMKDGVLTVIAPLKDSPAERAGFLPGDIIYKIDGVEITDLPMEEVIQKIRGTKGTRVNIEIVRKGEPKPITLSPIRDTIVEPNTEVTTVDGVTVISLYTFTRDSILQMYDALSAVRANNERAVILDLRGNPGGLLDSAVEMSSMILPKNAAIVRERPGHRNKTGEDVYRSKGYGVLPSSISIVVLMNEGSASASEILAGAIQDHDRGVVIGSKSFGKGSVQEIVDMKDGSGIKITIAKWYTPDNVSISEKGIQPDIQIIDSNPGDDVDEVMLRAIEFVKSGK